MDWLEVIVLALVQAATEFLPVSSSGHLILVPAFVDDWQGGGIAFDVALHLGTLIAVIAYFRDDVRCLLLAWWQSMAQRRRDDETRLAWGIALSAVPAAVVGLLFNDWIEHALRSPAVVAVQLAVFGLLLWAVDRLARRDRDIDSLGMLHWLALGCAQAVALVPGTSRSGVTMTMARALGLPRVAAARVSFLMAIPVIAMASAYEGWAWMGQQDGQPASVMLTGVVVAALSGYACIHWFMRLIGRIGFGVFAVYRLLLAGLILLVLY